MKTSLDSLLTRAYEVEGLLLALERHGNDTPLAVIDALEHKSSCLSVEVSELVEELRARMQERQDAQSTQGIAESDAGQQAEDEPQGIDDEPIADSEQSDTEDESDEQDYPSGIEVFDEDDDAEPAGKPRDIARAMSLNDRFRFARELFGNDYPRMDAALAAAQAMPTPQAAIDFLTGEAGVDPDNEVIAELAEIINQIY